MGKTAIVTGATSGIGEAVALALAAEGYDLIITGRRAPRLRELKKQIAAEFKTHVLPLGFDIRDRVRTEAALDALPEEWRSPCLLVNNAGLAAGLEHIDQGDPLDWDAMIDTNVKGLLYITRKVAPMMMARGGGHIVNIGSIAGMQTYENGAVYCASKHAVHALSQGMRIDFLGAGIKVTEICPGMVETEFSVVRFHGDQARADAVYEGVTPLTGDDIADAVTWAVGQPEHVNIDQIVITPRQQANAYYTCRKK